MSYRREPLFPLRDDDISAAVTRYIRERRPPRPGSVFCGECRDTGCDSCRREAGDG